MSIACIRGSLVTLALLALLRGSAHGQAPPAPAASEVPAAGSGVDPATVKAARQARAAGQVIEVTDEDVVAGCRDLGDTYQDTAEPDVPGRVGIREALQRTGRARGASHIRYSGHVTIRESGAQREHGHLYDCTLLPAPRTATAATAGSPAPAAGVAAAAERWSPFAGLVVSGQFEVVPVGTLHSKSGMQPVEADIPTAYGVGGNLAIALGPNVAFALNPGVVLGVKPSGTSSSATEVDLRARLQFGQLKGEGFHEYGYAAVGASWLLLPGEGDSPSGATVGVGAGVIRHVETSSFLILEVGFQAGFQTVPAGSTEVEFSSRLFHVGLGFGRFLPF